MSIAIDLEPIYIVNTVTSDTVKEYNSDETCKVTHLSSSNDDTDEVTSLSCGNNVKIQVSSKKCEGFLPKSITNVYFEFPFQILPNLSDQIVFENGVFHHVQCAKLSYLLNESSNKKSNDLCVGLQYHTAFSAIIERAKQSLSKIPINT